MKCHTVCCLQETHLKYGHIEMLSKKVKITLPPNFSNVKVGKWASDKANLNALINRISNITWQQKFHNNKLFPHSQNNNESDTNLKLMQSEGNK